VGRRFFIGAATTTYQFEDGADRPELAESLETMRALFTRLTYQVVDRFGLNMPKDEFTGKLRAFLTDRARQATDVVVVYYTGHGIRARDDLLLPTCDSTGDLSYSALRATDLTARLLEPIDGEMPLAVQQLLFILDTCHAANATMHMSASVVGFLDRLRGTAEHPSLAVIAGSRPYERIPSGAFTQALADAVNHHASGGLEQEFLALDTLTGLVGTSTPEFQHARFVQVSEGPSPFFPNPRFDRWLGGIDLRTQVNHRLRRDRDRDLTTHVLPRAQGLDASERDDLWLFQGRHQALRELCDWLRKPQAATTIVTGDPGSGKSALLSRLFILADARRRGRIPNLHLLPIDTLPTPGSITEYVHARGQNPQDLLAALSHACGVDVADSVSRLIADLRASAGTPRTIIVDAVDEAVGSGEDSIRLRSPVVDEVLAPLVSAAGHCGLRLLIGTRRHLITALGGPSQLVNLDDESYADHPSVKAYAKACLTELSETSPYRRQPAPFLDAVADAIAAAAGNSFLVSLITARSHALDPDLVNPYDQVWQAGLPRFASDAMREDLNRRLGGHAGKARDLLLPLAYAEGSGLPWEDLWPALVTALTDRACANSDLDWLVEHAGYYIIEALHDMRSVYRLYHESLAEHLREGRDVEKDQAAIADLLASRVPRLVDGTADWSQAHPYTRATIATHAAAGRRLDQLIIQPRLLLHTSPAALHTALPHAQSAQGHAIADAYQRTDARLRANPPNQHASYLQLAALCARAPQLAEAVAKSGLPLPWTTDWASWRLQPTHHTITGHTSAVYAVAVGNLEGRTVVVSGSDDQMVRMWEAVTGLPIGDPFIGHTGPVYAVAMGQVEGNAVIVSGGGDGTVRVWNVASGALIGVPLIGHSGPVNTVAMGQVGGRTIVVSGSDDQTVRVWDAASGTPIGVPLAGHKRWVRAVTVGQVEGRTVIVSGGDDRAVRIWDAVSGAPIGRPLIAHTGWVRAVAVGQMEGRTVVVSGGNDETVRIWDAATGTPLGRPLTGHNGYVTSLAVGQVNGRMVIASGSNDHTVRVWDAITSAPVGGAFTGHTGPVNAAAVGVVEGRAMVVSASNDETVRVWDAAIGTPVGDPFTGHTGPVNAVAVGRVGGREVIVSGSNDRMVRLWDAASGAPVGGPLAGHTGPVNAVALGQVNGRSIVVAGSEDHAVRVWDSATGSPLAAPFQGHTNYVMAVAVGQVDGRTVIVSGSSDRTVRIWEAATGVPIGEPLADHSGGVRAVAVGRIDGRTVIVSGSSDRTVRIWEAATGAPIGEPLADHNGGVRAVAVGRIDGRTVIASGSEDRMLRVFDMPAGTPRGVKFAGHAGTVNAVAVGQVNGRGVVVSGSGDRTVRMWDSATGKLFGDLLFGHHGPVNAVAVGQVNGRTFIVSGSDDRTLRLWEAATGGLIGEPLASIGSEIRAVAVGRVRGRAVIVAGCEDRALRVFDVETGRPVGGTFPRHAGPVNAVAVGPVDGRAVVVSGSGDQTVRMWNAATGTPLGDRLTGHVGPVNAVAMGLVDGRTVVVSGSDDRTVRLWDAATGMSIGDPFTGHTGQVNTVALGQVGGRTVVVSGSNDQTIRVSTLSGELILTINLAARVTSTAITATDQIAVTTALGIACIRFAG
jgi:WD40 repeat protein